MQRANIVINDGASTPLAHTFNPAGETNGVHMFENRASGQPIGFERLTLSVRPPGDRSRGVYKVVGKLQSPILEQTSPSTASGIQPAPIVAYTTTGEFSFLMPTRGTKQQRKDARILLINALQNALVVALTDDLEDIW